MSKSGVFAHFGSRDELQIAVIREYHNKFEEEVFFPALREPRGLPRLRALFEQLGAPRERWRSTRAASTSAVPSSSTTGPARCATPWSTWCATWQDALERAIRIGVEEGHLKPDTDPPQMLFEVHGLILALHHDARFLRHPGALERARIRLSSACWSDYAAPGVLEDKTRRPQNARPARAPFRT